MPYEVDPEDERIHQLLERDRIGNLTIKGELEVAEKDEIEVYIDDSQSPKGLLITDYWVKIYVQDEGALAKLLPAIAQKEEARFGGVAAWIRDYLVQDWEITWENPCWLYYLKAEDLREELIRHEIRSLRPEDAELVNEHWEFGSAESLGYVRWRIEAGPSCAIFDQDKPVSWALTHGDGQMGMMFTLPEARHKGYGLSITVALAKEILARGKIPFLYTLHDNLLAQRLAERAGFRRWDDYRWFRARRRG
jgi:8-oxo-dGTP diphosphatase